MAEVNLKGDAVMRHSARWGGGGAGGGGEVASIIFQTRVKYGER